MKLIYLIGILIFVLTFIACNNKARTQKSNGELHEQVIASLVSNKYGSDYSYLKNDSGTFALVLQESTKRKNQPYPDLDITIIDINGAKITGEHQANLAMCKWSSDKMIELTIYPPGIPSDLDEDFGPKTYNINPETGRKFLKRK